MAVLRQGSGGQAAAKPKRRSFADVERSERARERDGFRELITQKQAGLRHAIAQGRISAEMADQVEWVMISMADDVNAGLHRMDLSGDEAPDKRRKK